LLPGKLLTEVLIFRALPDVHGQGSRQRYLQFSAVSRMVSSKPCYLCSNRKVVAILQAEPFIQKPEM
jgi:hypothetical protein